MTVTETFNYQKFYEDYKDEIHNLSREDFAGLNINLRMLALNEFSIEKKHEWWNDKLENTLKINSFSDEQIDFIKQVKSYFILDFFDKSKNEKIKDEVLTFVEKDANKVGLNDDLINKIFMNLNNMDSKLGLINFSENSIIATPITAKAINFDSETIQYYYSKPEDPISNTPNCQNYGCFFCLGSCDCTTACAYVPNSCGIGGVFDCHAICCP